MHRCTETGSASTRSSLRRALSALAAGAVVALLGLATASPADAAAAPDRWTGVFGDAGNSSTNLAEHSIIAARAGQVRQTWEAAAGASGLSAEAPLILGGTAYWISGRDRLVATSAVTGATRWTLHLTGGQDYSYGMAAAGTRLVISFRGTHARSGVAAVDVQRRKVLWRALLPRDTSSPTGDTYPGMPYTDGTRVFLSGGDDDINAYRLSSGRALWRTPVRNNSNGTIQSVDGIAAGGGLVFTSGQRGLVAREATTGRTVWRSTQATSGRPVLAGGRVVTATGSGQGAESFTATGCRASTCAPSWRIEYIDPELDLPVTVAAADSAHVYLTYTTSHGSPTQCSSAFTGHVSRLSATTGAVQWAATAGTSALGLIHGGDALWLYSETIRADCVSTDRVIALPATGSSTGILADFDLGPSSGFPQALSVADGTLLRQDRLDPLTGYRITAP